MTGASLLWAIQWLIRDTFRQSLASRVFWFLLGFSALCIGVCASIRIEEARPLGEEFVPRQGERGQTPAPGVPVLTGRTTFGFGIVSVPLPRTPEAEAHFLHSFIGKRVAGTLGILLALIWTSAFLPNFLEPGSASVLLAKPVPRWTLLLGKYLGVLTFVAFHALILIGGTWLALGLATGYWVPGYLLAFPLILLQFMVIYSFSVLIAVMTRSPVACIFATLVFWFACIAMNYGHHALAVLPQVNPSLPPPSPLVQGLIETGYWIMPKPADLDILLDQAMKSSDFFSLDPVYLKFRQSDDFRPFLSILSSLLFAAVLVGISARELGKMDY